MDLFFLRAFFRGKLMTTPKFENAMAQVQLDAKRYRQVEKSDKLKEYQELDKVVNAPAFQDKKKELTTKKYADSEEFKQLAKLKKLASDKYVRKYLKTGQGESRSAVQKYIDIKAQTETPEFKKRNNFWADAKRWEGTEEGKKEARYLELKKDEDILFFQQANLKNIELVEHFKPVYQDDFNWTRLTDSDWTPGFVYPSKDFVKEHSFTDEQQAYNNGKNVETQDSILKIQTIKEQIEAPAWDPKKGIVKKEFSFSSDILSNDKVAIEEGDVVQVKVRCRGFVNHGIYLRSAKHVPYISLFNYDGRKLYVSVKDSLKQDSTRKYLDGLQPIPYTVFTVSWQKDQITWYINNLEVFHTKNVIPKGEKLYVHMFSFIFEHDKVATNGELQVDWLRILKPAATTNVTAAAAKSTTK